MYTFLTKLIFFTFAQIRDFRGLSLRSFDKAGNFTFGLKEQLIFPEIDYDDVDQTQGFTITIVLENCLPKYRSTTMDRILNGMILFKFLRFLVIVCGYWGGGRKPPPKWLGNKTTKFLHGCSDIIK